MYTCEEVIAPEHGSVSSDTTHRTLGSTVIYTCDEGFAYSGFLSAVCFESGWSSPKPDCIGKNKSAQYLRLRFKLPDQLLRKRNMVMIREVRKVI